MDKVKRTNGVNAREESLQIFNILDKLDEIVDWITVHDKHKAELRAGLKELGYTLDSPSIEQEIEAGLLDGNNGHWYVLKGNRAEGCGIKKDSCTQILLPMDKWEGFVKVVEDELCCGMSNPQGRFRREYNFHDIPVTYWGGDKIEWLTE